MKIAGIESIPKQPTAASCAGRFAETFRRPLLHHRHPRPGVCQRTSERTARAIHVCAASGTTNLPLATLMFVAPVIASIATWLQMLALQSAPLN